jgi:hypothetical protein
MVTTAMAQDSRATDPMQLAALRERVRALHERVAALGRHL